VTDPTVALIGAAIALLKPLFNAPSVVPSIEILPKLELMLLLTVFITTPALTFVVTPLMDTPAFPAMAPELMMTPE
jgi:hypothetical protein